MGKDTVGRITFGPTPSKLLKPSKLSPKQRTVLIDAPALESVVTELLDTLKPFVEGSLETAGSICGDDVVLFTMKIGTDYNRAKQVYEKHRPRPEEKDDG